MGAPCIAAPAVEVRRLLGANGSTARADLAAILHSAITPCTTTPSMPVRESVGTRQGLVPSGAGFRIVRSFASVPGAAGEGPVTPPLPVGKRPDGQRNHGHRRDHEGACMLPTSNGPNRAGATGARAVGRASTQPRGLPGSGPRRILQRSFSVASLRCPHPTTTFGVHRPRAHTAELGH